MRNIGFTIALLATLLGCSKPNAPEPSAAEPGAPEAKPEPAAAPPAAEHIDLQGAGATFPYPLYSKWVSEYQKVDPRVRINYQSIGSGGGVRQITERTVDFGASDATMSDEELGK